MASKYIRSPRVKKQPKETQTNTEKPMESKETQQTSGEENIHEKHKEFLKSAQESVKQNNEPILETTFKKSEAVDHPFEVPTIEREYTTQGIKKEAPQPKPQTSEFGGADKPPVEPTTTNNTGSSSSQQGSEFEATPPPADDENYAETHNPNEDAIGEDGSTMNIPTGNAEDLVDFGAKGLNFIIGNFAGLLVNIKIKPEYHSIRDNKTRAIDIIKDFNDKSVNSLKLDAEDIAMLKGPLVKLLKEKGIRGLTPAEELMLAIAMIGAKKVKAIMEIKSEAKKLSKHFDSMIRYMKGEPEPETKIKEEQKDEQVYEDVVVEEM